MLKKVIGIVVVIVTILLIVIMVKSKKRPSFDQEKKSPELKLIMENISPIKEGVIITANGNVMAKWQTEIKSEVIGPINTISDNLLVGASFTKGDNLLSIESINYESQLSRQLANLARAQELLFEEQVKSDRAINDWKSLNSNKPANDFTIRKPQLNSAKMNLKAAELDLKVAKNNLSKTTIKAPYDGFVISKFVDLGETIQIGTKIADVFSSEDLELILPLNNTQIEMILSSNGKEIKIYDINNPEKYWLAQFSRVDQMIDQKSRWRNLFLTIDQKDNTNKVLPIQGSFLKAEITLDLNNDFLRIDEKSLSMQGDIWLVGSDQLLKKVRPSISFRNNGYIYLYPLENLDYPIKLVSVPSSTLLEGVKVSQQKLSQEISEREMR
jgi:RND family efflux transporter MFP subunit